MCLRVCVGGKGVEILIKNFIKFDFFTGNGEILVL